MLSIVAERIIHKCYPSQQQGIVGRRCPSRERTVVTGVSSSRG